MALDSKFFKPFIEGTLNTLKIQCGLDATAGKPFPKGTREELKFEIAGIVAISSSSFSGNLSLCFPGKVYLALMNNMLGKEVDPSSQEFQDGAAELLNIILGCAKVILNQQGHDIQKAIPTVIRGESLTTTYLTKQPVFVLPFSIACGDFQIELSSI